MPVKGFEGAFGDPTRIGQVVMPLARSSYAAGARARTLLTPLRLWHPVYIVWYIKGLGFFLICFVGLHYWHFYIFLHFWISCIFVLLIIINGASE